MHTKVKMYWICILNVVLVIPVVLAKSLKECRQFESGGGAIIKKAAALNVASCTLGGKSKL